jgi:hypothetical protein
MCFQTTALAQSDTKPKAVSNEADRIVVSMVGNKLSTENAPIGKKIEIFSIIGLRVVEIEIKTHSAEYLLNVPKGYYILKISDTVRKVAIR